MAQRETITVRSLAVGGEAVGRAADGRALFVAGALPGERIVVDVVAQRRRWVRAELVEVLEPSPDRVEPPCRWQRAGCGGCDLMHASPAAQRRARQRMAVESLERLGKVEQPDVRLGPELAAEAVRTTLRVAIRDGRPAYRRRASHGLVAVDSCRVAHPALAELLADGHFGRAVEVTLRVSAATGERLAVVAPEAGGVRLPDDVAVVSAAELSHAAAHPAHLHEEVAGHRWRVSAGSFFQSSAVGASALVDTVAAAVQGPTGAGSGRRALDAYCGVGLLGAALVGCDDVVAVESSGSSVDDAVDNGARWAAGGPAVRVLRRRVERWRPVPRDVVVADPARRGLGRDAAAVLAATGAGCLVLVSCDLAALGRDCADLVSLGYRHGGSTVLDLFPHTSHAEVVTRFERR